MAIHLKRIYEPHAPDDGRRILVDRLWPRGMTREAARLDFWAKRVAPSHELRRWFGHDPAKWDEFQARYHAELDANAAGLEEIRGQLDGAGVVTFLFSSKEERLNHAVVLRGYLGGDV